MNIYLYVCICIYVHAHLVRVFYTFSIIVHICIHFSSFIITPIFILHIFLILSLSFFSLSFFTIPHFSLTYAIGDHSFKNVIENFAANNNITFLPKNGKLYNNKQIYIFGKSSCYIDQDVVFVSIVDNPQNNKIWKPVSLEELLKIS